MKIELYTSEKCGPCNHLKGYIHQADCEVEYFSLDEHPERFKELRIRAVPHLRFLEDDGWQFYQHTGLMSLEDINEMITLHKTMSNNGTAINE